MEIPSIVVKLLLVLIVVVLSGFFFNDTATTEIYTYLHTLSLHDALPISSITLAALERTQVSVDASSPFHSSRVELEVLLARAHLLRSLGKADAMAPILDAADGLARQLGRAMDRA